MSKGIVVIIQFVCTLLVLTGSICDPTTTAETTTLPSSAGTTPCLTYTSGGNAAGANCVFPFIYQGRQYWECTPKDAAGGKLWCATTSNYDLVDSWGYCQGRSSFSKLKNVYTHATYLTALR